MSEWVTVCVCVCVCVWGAYLYMVGGGSHCHMLSCCRPCVPRHGKIYLNGQLVYTVGQVVVS